MKKWCSGIFLVIMMLLIVPINVMAEEIVNDNIPYEFPIKPESVEWENFNSKQEMLDVCQIPEDKLKSMTTEALLETVLNYPLVTTYYAFNNVKDAYNTMLYDFNGFEELFSRKDISEELINKYIKVNILDQNEAKAADSREVLKSSTIEYLISCNEIQNGVMSDKNNQVFEQVLRERSLDRNEKGIYSEFSDIYMRFKNESKQNKAGENWQSVTGKVKTPKGNEVPDVYKRTPELTSEEKLQLIMR